MGTKLLSKEAKNRVPLRVFNLTTYSVEVIWINYRGHEQLYTTLIGPQSFDLDTFETHPWIFRESRSRRQLAIFEGTPGYPRKVLLPIIDKPNTRKPVFITNPIENLRDICFLALKRSSLKADKIDQVDLPRELKIDYEIFLKRCIAL